MVLCSKAAIGTCCTADPGHPGAGKPAWKGSANIVTVGSSCADARASFCRQHGTLGTKFCPAQIQSRVPKGFIPIVRPVVNSPQCGRTISGKFQCCTGNPPNFKVVQTASRADCCARFGNGGRCFNDQPDAAAPAGAPATQPSFTESLCPYFKWIPVADNCNVQVSLGLGAVAIGVILLIRVLR